MAENETEQTAEQAEGTQEVQEQEVQNTDTTGTETKETETKEETKEKPKETIIEKIGSMVQHAKEVLSGNSDADMTDVPDEFTKVARALNWSDEDTKKFTEDYTNEQLLEMIPSLTGADTAKVDENAKTSDTTKSDSEKKVEDSQEDEGRQELLDRITELEKAQGIRDERSEKEKFEGFANKASDLFDKASEEFEVFGKTDSLPAFPDGQIIPTSPQMKARVEVWDVANQLKQAGMSDDQALEISLNAYKGQHLAVETKRNVIKELKKNEQRLGGKRTSHETVVGGDGKELSGPEVIKEVARRHGMEMRD